MTTERKLCEAHQAAIALDCGCGHSERLHQWSSVGNPGLTRIAGCGNWERLPREGDEPEVRYAVCVCEQYDPTQPREDQVKE